MSTAHESKVPIAGIIAGVEAAIIFLGFMVYITPSSKQWSYDARMRDRGVCEYLEGKVIADDPSNNLKIICLTKDATLKH